MAVRHRRETMRLRQADLEALGGPGSGTVRNIEQAARDKYASRTFTQLEQALQWPAGVVAKILDGTVTAEELNAKVVTGTAHAQLGLVAEAARGHRPLGGSVSAAAGARGHLTVADSGRATDSVDVTVYPDTAVGTGQAFSPEVIVKSAEEGARRAIEAEQKKPVRVTVAELLERLSELEKEAPTPTMPEAVDSLRRLLPELYGQEYRRRDEG